MLKLPFYRKREHGCRHVNSLGTLVLAANDHAELNEVRPELDQLQTEVGHLEIGDSSDFHVIQVPTADTFRWRWRIRLPDGVEARLICLAGEIPKTGFESRKWKSLL